MDLVEVRRVGKRMIILLGIFSFALLLRVYIPS